LKAFFSSLSQLQDFISVRPQPLLNAYFGGDGDAFLVGCEADMLRLRDMTAMLARQQRKESFALKSKVIVSHFFISLCSCPV